jgi:hypothetical protein
MPMRKAQTGSGSTVMVISDVRPPRMSLLSLL